MCFMPITYMYIVTFLKFATATAWSWYIVPYCNLYNTIMHFVIPLSTLHPGLKPTLTAGF